MPHFLDKFFRGSELFTPNKIKEEETPPPDTIQAYVGKGGKMYRTLEDKEIGDMEYDLGNLRYGFHKLRDLVKYKRYREYDEERIMRAIGCIEEGLAIEYLEAAVEHYRKTEKLEKEYKSRVNELANSKKKVKSNENKVANVISFS